MMLRTLRRIRRSLYTTAKYMGDVDAAATGRVGPRIARRVVWRYVTALLRWALK